MLRAGKYIGTFKLAILASMIYMRLGGVELQEADKAWRESASKPKVQMSAANPQLVRRLLLAWPVHSRRRFNQFVLSRQGNAIELEHILAHRERVWIGRCSIKAYLKVSETHLDRRASSGSTFDSRAKVFVYVLGDADKAFRATSVERERNYTSSRRSDQNSMVISFDERRAGAKLWWGRLEAPSVPI